MSTELPPKYEPQTLEPAVTARWLATKAFAASPDDRDERYVVMMPLPRSIRRTTWFSVSAT